jgi:hypothetical protein
MKNSKPRLKRVKQRSSPQPSIEDVGEKYDHLGPKDVKKAKKHWNDWKKRWKARNAKRFELMRRVFLAYNAGKMTTERFYQWLIEQVPSHKDNLWVVSLMSEIRHMNPDDMNKIFDAKKEDWIRGRE